MSTMNRGNVETTAVDLLVVVQIGQRVQHAVEAGEQPGRAQLEQHDEQHRPVLREQGQLDGGEDDHHIERQRGDVAHGDVGQGGDDGGYLVAEGTPEDISKVPESYTGYFLRRYLG